MNLKSDRLELGWIGLAWTVAACFDGWGWVAWNELGWLGLDWLPPERPRLRPIPPPLRSRPNTSEIDIGQQCFGKLCFYFGNH